MRPNRVPAFVLRTALGALLAFAAGCAGRSRPAGAPAKKARGAEISGKAPGGKGKSRVTPAARKEAPACCPGDKCAPCPEPKEKEKAKAKAESKPDARELVRDLGHLDFEKREAAAAALAGMGEKALPALKEGSASSDAEVAHRCRQLRARLADARSELPEIPASLLKSFKWAWKSVWRGGHGPGAGGNMGFQLKGPGGQGIKLTNMRRTGSDTRSIGNKDARITVTVRSDGTVTLVLTPRGGKPRTYKYSAKSEADFRKKHPNFTARYLK